MLDNVKTVQDLIDLNNTKEESIDPSRIKENILSQIMDQEPEMGIEIVMSLLSAIKDFHINVINTLKNKGEYNDALVWTYDMALVTNAMEILSEVEL